MKNLVVQDEKGRLLCQEEVRDGGRWPSFHQCTHIGTVERDGKMYCRLHDPVVRKEKADAKYAEYRNRLDKQANKHAARQELEALLPRIRFVLESIGEGVAMDEVKLLQERLTYITGVLEK